MSQQGSDFGHSNYWILFSFFLFCWHCTITFYFLFFILLRLLSCLKLCDEWAGRDRDNGKCGSCNVGKLLLWKRQPGCSLISDSIFVQLLYDVRFISLWADENICTELWGAASACVSALLSIFFFFLHVDAFTAESWLCHEIKATPLNGQRDAWSWNYSAKTLVRAQIHVFVYKYPT